MQTKQALGLKGGSGGDWKPTSNDRNEAMINDARKFSKQLKLLHAVSRMFSRASRLNRCANRSRPAPCTELAPGPRPCLKLLNKGHALAFRGALRKLSLIHI